MKNKLCALLFLGCLTALLTGCVGTLDGHSKMGVPFTKDKIEGRYERPADQIFIAARDVLAFNGQVTAENTITKTLQAKVDTRTVWVRVTEIDPKTSQVLVQARTKGGGADVDLASEIDKQIALRLVK